MASFSANRWWWSSFLLLAANITWNVVNILCLLFIVNHNQTESCLLKQSVFQNGGFLHLLQSVYWNDLAKDRVLIHKKVRELVLSMRVFFTLFEKQTPRVLTAEQELSKTHDVLERPVNLLSHKVLCLLRRTALPFPFLSCNINLCCFHLIWC